LVTERYRDITTVTVAENSAPCILANMKGTLAFALIPLFISIVPNACSAASSPAATAKAQQLRHALSQLQRDPNNRGFQREYIRVFPHDYKVFLELFDLDHPLYDGADFIAVLSSLDKTFDTEVGNLLIELSKDAHYEADAPGYLQNATAVFASQHTETFLSSLKRLPADKQGHLVGFLADVENFRSYPEYQLIIDHSIALGEVSIARQFESARAKRSQQPND